MLQACSQSGASVARLARLHGLNANVVHRRHVDERNAVTPALRETPLIFLAVNIISETRTAANPPPPSEIRVEVTRFNATIIVKWPLQECAACAAGLPGCASGCVNPY